MAAKKKSAKKGKKKSAKRNGRPLRRRVDPVVPITAAPPRGKREGTEQQ